MSTNTKLDRCSNCGREIDGEHLGGSQRPYRDVTDTDRGDWVQEGWEWICNECEEEENEAGEESLEDRYDRELDDEHRINGYY